MLNHEWMVRPSLSSRLESLVRFAQSKHDACQVRRRAVTIRSWRSEPTGLSGAALRSLTRSAENLPPDVAVVLHGSGATGEFLEFSDVDVVVAVPSRYCRTIDAANGLRRSIQPLRRALYEIDPLAHHGVMVIPPGWPIHYNEFILPTQALACAVSLRRDDIELSFAVCQTCSQLAAVTYLRSYLASMLHITAARKSWYQAKFDLAFALLLPALWLEGKQGDFPYKRESFGLFRQFVPREVGDAIEAIESLRVAWRVPSSYRRSVEILSVFLPADIAARLVARVDRGTEALFGVPPSAEALASLQATLASWLANEL